MIFHLKDYTSREDQWLAALKWWRLSLYAKSGRLT